MGNLDRLAVRHAPQQAADCVDGPHPNPSPEGEGLLTNAFIQRATNGAISYSPECKPC
jgi:hypothetical protein